MKIQEIELFQVDIPPIPAIAKYMPKIFDLQNVNSPEDLARGTAAVHGITKYLVEHSVNCMLNIPSGRLSF